ncbi:MAG: Gfo/Idh/MocA family oxidoreductase [Candidatus Edwardsbacteria bacterium]|nr:Gfo/Idh/MocA family oxidoreductase [Candidatus Edwardsbacteria bacterium]
MKTAVIGLGYWGPNLLRNFLGNGKVTGVWGCDVNQTRLGDMKQKFPGIQFTDSYEKILSDPDIAAVAIATPVESHYRFAKQALEAGKHVWVEKPFTSSSHQALELIELAERANLRIFVDHTFIYTGAVRKIKELMDQNELGDIIYFDSVRINLGLFQHDVNVIWDLAPHDLSIMSYVLDKTPVAVSANGIGNYGQIENVAHLSLYFAENCFAHFHVNWTSPVKIRRMILGGNKKMLVFDDMENSEKIKVYDSRVEINGTDGLYNALVQYRIGEMYSPKVNQTEALSLAVREFVDAINEKRRPLTSGTDGLKVVKLLEASDISIKNKGKLVEIK